MQKKKMSPCHHVSYKDQALNINTKALTIFSITPLVFSYDNSLVVYYVIQ